MEEQNPFLQQEDYMAPYQKKINELRNKPEVIEWDKLCFELFEINPQGKRWLELVTERYLLPGLCRPGTQTYQIDIIFWDGFKEFARMLLMAIKSHQHRINSGK